MATVSEMKATARPKVGKGAARAARHAGRVPGVIYGDNKPPLAISVDHVELRKRIYAGRFLTTIYDIDVDGTKHRVIPRDFQLDPSRTSRSTWISCALRKARRSASTVRCTCINADQSPGVKRGGAVNIVTHTVDVRCPAEAIPGRDRRRYRRARDQPLQASQRRALPPGVKVIGAWRHHAGDHRAAVRLRRRTQGRRRSALPRLPLLPQRLPLRPRRPVLRAQRRAGGACCRRPPAAGGAAAKK